jgi:hypothetical protein
MPLAHDLVSGVLPAAHSRVACFSLSALLRTRKLPSQRFPPLALPQGPLHPVLDDVQQTVAFHNNIFPYLSFAWGTVIMSKGVKEVVQIVAPIALKALVTAAEALIAGAAYADKRSLHNLLAASGDDASIIENDTTTYVNTNFATTFGYYYEGLRSRPTTGALPITASQDILIWDAGGKNIQDIQNYLQTVWQDTVSPSDAISIAQNMGELFQDRFQEESLDWTPFNKLFQALVHDRIMTGTAGQCDESSRRRGKRAKPSCLRIGETAAGLR